MTDAKPPRRYKRLSADLPQHWLDDPVFGCLSHEAWRLWTGMLMWAIDRTDGEIPRGFLPRLMPGTDEDRSLAVKELVALGLIVETPTGWRIPTWTEHQSTVEQIEDERERKRQNQADHRTEKCLRGDHDRWCPPQTCPEKIARRKQPGSPPGSPATRPVGSPPGSPAGYGTERKERTNSTEERSVEGPAENDGEVPAGSCWVCHKPLGEAHERAGRDRHPGCDPAKAIRP